MSPFKRLGRTAAGAGIPGSNPCSLPLFEGIPKKYGLLGGFSLIAGLLMIHLDRRHALDWYGAGKMEHACPLP
jgi:hypothetical protein